MSDWKQSAIDAYERMCEEQELKDVEHKNFRIDRAREQLIEALQALNIPLPADAEIRVDDHDDDAELGALPYVTIEGVEFTYGPKGTKDHGGGVGIVTTCPRCQQRIRGPYLHAQEILGRELLNPERVSHVCQTEEERALDAQVAEATAAEPSSSVRLFGALCDLIDLRIEIKTGAA